ncbi:MAG: carboxy terminal-processing peptidase [Verrucomicrobia bacterium]|nr:carboxy terminal-processing peptidase [Verrucomicrobiota bacterium]
MKLKSSLKILLLLGLPLAQLPAWGADATALPESLRRGDDKTLLTREGIKSNAIVPLVPGPDDAPIARLTARVLQQFQYRRQVFNDTVSSNFLARFMSDLDPLHIHFLQGDADDFSNSYRTNLDDLTLRYGDTTPAYEVFNRFLGRLTQRTAYAENLLKTEKFQFTADERVTVNRHTLPYPKDVAEARKIWRERVRFEYLQELLNAANPIKTTNAPAAKPKTPEQVHDDIVKTLTKRYDRILKLFKEWDADDVLQLYLTTLAHVYDPHSDYFGKAQFEEFSMGMNLALFGIGALLQSDEDGYCKIKELKPGPALKCGKIKPNDRIVAVAQGTNEPVDVVDMPLNKVVQLIRGPKNSEVRLTIIPAEATDLAIRKVVALVREEIKLEDSAAKAKLIELPGGKGGKLRLGVIDLPSFYAPMDINQKEKTTARSTTADVTKLLVKLAEEKADGIILDLRRNGGGSLEEAIKLTGLFIKRGPVVQVRDPNGEIIVKADEDPAELYDGPLIVLTSRFSASASEIVAGALQDYGRALIVGDTTTHGKGTVQTLTPLAPFLRGNLWTSNDPGTLKITISKFYRPSGSSTQLKGVASDIVLPSIDNVADIGEGASENPLPWDTITSSDYDHMNRIAPLLGELRKRSARRVAQARDFDYVREDVTLYQKAQADKTVSLNEAQRLKETQEDTARKKARDAEIAARKDAARKVYEISLKQAEIPGLPPPVTKTNTVAANSATVLIGTNTLTTLAAVEASEDEKAPTVDVNLEEAEHILVDYLGLLPATSLAAVKR